MTAPRCIRPGKTWFVTRRTTRRFFLLRPDADATLQKLYWYTTALIAQECGIEIHAVQMLSTHIHEVLTDTRGELPRFLQQRNRLLANAIKAHRDWPEEVFARAPASCVALYGNSAILKEIGYTLANCVEAGLVNHPDEWPGVSVSVDEIGGEGFTAVRPEAYFDEENTRWPPSVEVRFTMPPTLVDAYAGRASAVLRSAVDSAIGLARRAAAAARRVVRSAASLVRVPHDRRAQSREPFGKRMPNFAAGGDRVQLAVAKRERRTFLDQYRNALERLKEGCRDVLFPHGTWRLHQEFRFECGANAQRRSDLLSGLLSDLLSDLLPRSFGSPVRAIGPSVSCQRRRAARGTPETEEDGNV